jgi:hypothetical protein
MLPRWARKEILKVILTVFLTEVMRFLANLIRS